MGNVFSTPKPILYILCGNSSIPEEAGRQVTWYSAQGYEVRVWSVRDSAESTVLKIAEWIVQDIADREVILMGFSLGGHIAIEIAKILGGSQVKGVVLEGTPPCGPNTFMMAFNKPENDPDLLRLLGWKEPFTLAEAKRFAYPGFGWTIEETPTDFEDRALKKAILKNLTENHEVALKRELIHASIPECGDQAETIKELDDDIPILIIHGDQDPVINLEYIRGLEWANLHGIHVIKGAPHYANWHSHHEFNTRVDEFLASL